MYDAIVIGAGPNGLVGAAALARQGWKVLVLEAQSRPGGALYSEELTLPGYLHDVGAAFFPFAKESPALSALELEGAGLQWRNGRYESSHPARDGSCASIARDDALTAQSLGADAPAWSRLVQWRKKMGPRFVEALLAPLPAIGPAWRLGIGNVLRLTLNGLRTPAGWSRSRFRSAAAQRVIPALALHVDLGPNDISGAGLGLVLALLAASGGFRVPVGGARAITQAIIRRFEEAGGRLQLNTHVDQILVRRNRVVAVRTGEHDEIPVRRVVLADVGAPALFLRLLNRRHVASWLRWSMRRFRYGWGTFKVDWALTHAVPWSAAAARASAVVHTGENIDDLIHFTQEVRRGLLPSNPYLVIGQQSLVDSSRAPAGRHTLWAYSRVPSKMSKGWRHHREHFADRIEQRIEDLAPGFRSSIRARAIHSPDDLFAMDENLVGGDLGGGSAQLDQQLFLRPVFPYFRYRTPVGGLYLASASSPPGAGVHGACGWNAAQAALRDYP